MNKDLHDIDDLFRSALEENEETMVKTFTAIRDGIVEYLS